MLKRNVVYHATRVSCIAVKVMEIYGLGGDEISGEDGRNVSEIGSYFITSEIPKDCILGPLTVLFASTFGLQTN